MKEWVRESVSVKCSFINGMFYRRFDYSCFFSSNPITTINPKKICFWRQNQGCGGIEVRRGRFSYGGKWVDGVTQLGIGG